APNIYFNIKDTVEAGEPLDIQIAFKNVTESSFDSLKVNMVITDANNVAHVLPVTRHRPLNGLDTLHIHYQLDTRLYNGLNGLYIDVNPDNDQMEQYHFNNFAYRNFFVRTDSLNPLLDVTFDAMHILNNDIVSAKPAILIKLKDDAKWQLLDDTSLLNVQVRYPGELTARPYHFGNDTLRFTPAANATDNSATINFNPYFSEDGTYELIVSGKDKMGNGAGTTQYRVAFEVINKPMISNLLNYPNPFTTSTAFVFTLTGSEIPPEFKIQVLTVTGKVVKEITRAELGPLHIGRNITEYKWDGTDQYGQKLANGVYLYRVTTSLTGTTLEKYKSERDDTDKYFNKGYGKMYLMR
ncbi:MAG TPA: FlgD immunoglobulin-like domain containing protein, partial [Niastella sp.]|nr:FlgD immunoglobulin-like domain containing protein [Niastella sp.]